MWWSTMLLVLILGYPETETKNIKIHGWVPQDIFISANNGLNIKCLSSSQSKSEIENCCFSEGKLRSLFSHLSATDRWKKIYKEAIKMRKMSFQDSCVCLVTTQFRGYFIESSWTKSPKTTLLSCDWTFLRQFFHASWPIVQAGSGKYSLILPLVHIYNHCSRTEYLSETH